MCAKCQDFSAAFGQSETSDVEPASNSCIQLFLRKNDREWINRWVFCNMCISISSNSLNTICPLIDPFEGGEVAVGTIVAKAKEVCATANTDQPFMCLDLTFIAVLLKDGYGLNMKTNIKVSHTSTSSGYPLSEDNDFIHNCVSKFQLYKKIDGHEISWALGCAYNLLADMSRNTKPQ